MVVAVNVAVAEPLGTVTVAGTFTKVDEDERDTVKLPVGALLSVTVPVVELPLATVLGEKLSDATGSSTTVKIALAEVRGFVA